jgi:hypothetical protein
MLNTTGSQTITAADVAIPSISGSSADIAVGPPAMDAEHEFVQDLYFEVLGRQASMAELDGWVMNMSQPGSSHYGIVYEIEHSWEARTRLVQSWYVKYLGREASNGEEQGWVQSLLKGATEAQVLARILASVEFLARAEKIVNASQTNGSNSASVYVQALYEVLLNRTPSQSEVMGWVGSATSFNEALRGAIALAFLNSKEYRSLQVATLYAEVLDRPAGPLEIESWVLGPHALETVRSLLMSSDEYFASTQ